MLADHLVGELLVGREVVAATPLCQRVVGFFFSAMVTRFSIRLVVGTRGIDGSALGLST